jgi:hypothetical protein
MRKSYPRTSIAILLILAFSGDVFGWSCKTHTFIASEAGMMNPESACFPDVSKEENDDLLGPFHWHNAYPSATITQEYIDQYKVTGKLIELDSSVKRKINIRIPDHSGVLYWKILDLYQRMKGKKGWRYNYYLINIAHYVGDLSQPLHNFPYGDQPASDGKSYPEVGGWSKEKHGVFDSAIDHYLPLNGEKKEAFQNMVTAIQISSVDDLKAEICKVSNASISLANRCYAERRNMTKDEALKQLALSVSLLKGIIESTRRTEEIPK